MTAQEQGTKLRCFWHQDSAFDAACPQCEYVNKLLAIPAERPQPASGEHQPGEHHDYSPPTCRVCGVEGMLNLSIEPQSTNQPKELACDDCGRTDGGHNFDVEH